MGQRYLQLENSYTADDDGGGVLHVRQLPPNPAIFPPGPALLFVVVNGIPSVGMQVMVGSGKIEEQPVSAVATLPGSSLDTGGTSMGSHQPSAGVTSSKPFPAIVALFTTVILVLSIHII